MVLSAGTFFFDKEIAYKQLWGIVIKAEFLFVFVGLIKIGWFYFFKDGFTFEDVQYFYPLSLLNFTGYEGLETWWIYPLQVANLFEVLYWIILASSLGKELSTSFFESLKIVLSSYVPALIICVGFVMFFILNVS